MKRGRGSPNYGKHRTSQSNGYVRLWRPGHPMAAADGYALEHRVVLHDAGVRIPPGAHVHHRNGDKSDNRLENLAVLTPKDHALTHVHEVGQVVNQFGTFPPVEDRTCETCGKSFRPWKRGGRFCSRACSNRRHRP